METMRTNDDFTQNKNVLQESNKVTPRQSEDTHITNAKRGGSTSPTNTEIKTTELSFSIAKGRTTKSTARLSSKVTIKKPSHATSKITTLAPRTIRISPMKTTPSKYAQHLLCI